MKKFAVLVFGLAAAIWGGANYYADFWKFVPSEMQASVPEALRPYLNFPVPPAPVQTAQGGQRPGGAPGAGGPAGARPPGAPGGAGPGAGGRGGPPTPVAVATSKKKSMPYRVDAVGTVQTIATVAVRSRVDSQVESVLFADGSNVKQGDVMVVLDSRAIDAQLRQAEANFARDKANLELARQTLKRQQELANQNFATQQKLDETRANANALDAQVKADEAQVDNLRAQLGYYTIRAPISGKAGLANLRPGNIARSSDTTPSFTTINQMSPIYTSFSLPQRYFEELKASIQRGDSVVEATVQGGGGKVATGKLALLENAIDSGTGTIGVRAVFENKDEALWPGAIVTMKISLREDKDVLVVPREAVQMGQRGNYVFVVVDGVAKLKPVTVVRTVERETIIASGLNADEVIVIDGQLQIVDGARVQPRQGASSALGGQPAGNL